MIFPVTVTTLQTLFLVFNAAVSFTIMKGALENLKGEPVTFQCHQKANYSLCSDLANTVLYS